MAVQSVRNRVRQADLDAGHRRDGLTTEEREKLNRFHPQVRMLEEEREYLTSGGKGREGVHVRIEEGFRLVSAHRITRPVGTEVLVDASEFYASRSRSPSGRAVEDARPSAKLRAFHIAIRGTCGTWQIHTDLVYDGERAGLDRVARRLCQAGLEGASPRGWTATTTR